MFSEVTSHSSIILIEIKQFGQYLCLFLNLLEKLFPDGCFSSLCLLNNSPICYNSCWVLNLKQRIEVRKGQVKKISFSYRQFSLKLLKTNYDRNIFGMNYLQPEKPPTQYKSGAENDAQRFYQQFIESVSNLLEDVRRVQKRNVVNVRSEVWICSN